MIIKTLAVGPIMANCYIVGCENTKQAAVIDPGDEVDKILMAAAESQLTVKYILNTHGHFDHVGGNRRMKDATGAELLIHSQDARMLETLPQAAAAFGLSAESSPPPDGNIADGESISFGDITFRVLHTPGHSPGGVSFHSNGALFVGDTLFAGSIGRTDFEGGDFNTLITSIKNKLLPLGDDVTVYTGHGPTTTIGQEKRMNPFLHMA